MSRKIAWATGITASVYGFYKFAEWKWIEFEVRYRQASQLKIEYFCLINDQDEEAISIQSKELRRCNGVFIKQFS